MDEFKTFAGIYCSLGTKAINFAKLRITHPRKQQGCWWESNQQMLK